MPKFDSATFNMSEELWHLIGYAVDYCLTTVSIGSPLLPHGFASTNGKTCTVVRGEEQTEAALDKLRQGFARVNPCYHVIAFEGHFTPEGGVRTAAVFAEGFETDRASGARFALRYRPAASGVPFARLGNIAYLGDIARYSAG